MSGDGSRLESLHDVDQDLLDKLDGLGIQSISDLATKTASEFLEDYYSNYEDATGIDEETISNLVMRAKRKLIEDGLVQKEFSTAEDCLELRKKLIRFTSGSQAFDLFLGGGIETQALTEIAGEFGSGKSQLCYTICVTANVSKGSPDNGIIFVDTENTFRAERIHQIAESRGLDAEEIMKKIFVCRITIVLT
jgi:DNA repair protein RadA